MDFDAILIVAGSAVRLATPLLCACLAGLWSERSGIVDIGLEGKMLAAAFAGASAATATGSAMMGLGAGLGASLAIDRNGNQIVSGMAINMIAAGLTALVGAAWFGQGGRTPSLNGDARFSPLLFGLDGLTLVTILCAFFTWLFLYKSRFGLRLRAAGENPAALETAGVSVRRIRYAGVAMCGLLCGLGGTYLSVSQAAGFLPQMTAGKGFIALAALVFAKWKPIPALFTCLLFGALDAIAIRMQGISVPGIGAVPV